MGLVSSGAIPSDAQTPLWPLSCPDADSHPLNAHAFTTGDSPPPLASLPGSRGNLSQPSHCCCPVSSAAASWGRHVCLWQLGKAGGWLGLPLLNGGFSRSSQLQLPLQSAEGIHGSATAPASLSQPGRCLAARRGEGRGDPKLPRGQEQPQAPLPQRQHPEAAHGTARPCPAAALRSWPCPHGTSLPELHVQAAAEIGRHRHGCRAGAGCRSRERSAKAGVAPGCASVTFGVEREVKPKPQRGRNPQTASTQGWCGCASEVPPQSAAARGVISDPRAPRLVLASAWSRLTARIFL